MKIMSLKGAFYVFKTKLYKSTNRQTNNVLVLYNLVHIPTTTASYPICKYSSGNKLLKVFSNIS